MWIKKIKLEPAIIWKLVTCQRITSKRYSTSMGRHLSPRYGQVILVSGYPVLTAVNWSQHWCTICVQYQSSCATKLARKCEIEHWFSCGADGRAGGRSVYCHVITKFSGMGRFTYPWCSAGALRARAPLLSNCHTFTLSKNFSILSVRPDLNFEIFSFRKVFTVKLEGREFQSLTRVKAKLFLT